MRSFALFCLALVLGGVALAETQSLPLDRTLSNRTSVGALTYRGALVLPPAKGKFGGLSGIAITPDNKTLIALTDTNRIFRLSLKFSHKDRLLAATPDGGMTLQDADGAKKDQGKSRIDAEAIAALPDGWLIAYERQHRIMQFSDKDGLPHGVPVSWPPTLPEWKNLPDNAGFEALVAWPDGRVLAIAESRQEDTNPAWLWQDGNWQRLRYKSASGFAPSDAALLPDGDLLVLERGFNLFFGFRARLVRVAKADIAANTELNGQELARLESPLITENFEGLAVGKSPAGAVRLYLVSDNNFNAAQQTILAVFDLISPPETLR